MDDLAASILAHGLLQNLTVVEQSDTRSKHTGKYAVTAGGRRFAALTKLAKERAIPKTFGIPCRVIEHETATEVSLAENIVRVQKRRARGSRAHADMPKMRQPVRSAFVRSVLTNWVSVILAALQNSFLPMVSMKWRIFSLWSSR